MSAIIQAKGDIIGPASAADNDVAVFSGTTGKLVKTTALQISTIAGHVTGPGSAVSGNIATYSGTTGKIIADGAKLASDLVTGSASSVDGDLAVFDGTSGKIIKNVSPVAAIIPVGSVVDFAGTVEPAGWLFCFGQSLLRAGTYAALFAVIGTTYGAADGTHFSLPDLRGRVAAGKDDMGGTNANRLSTMAASATTVGGVGGAQTYALVLNDMPAHFHGFAKPTVAVMSGFASGSSFNMSDQAANTDTRGSGVAHNNIQPTFIFNKIIKI